MARRASQIVRYPSISQARLPATGQMKSASCYGRIENRPGLPLYQPNHSRITAMQFLAGLFVSAALFFLALHSNLTQWRLVPQSELDDLSRQIADARAQAETARMAAAKSRNEWMWDANRTPLDRANVAGHSALGAPR